MHHGIAGFLVSDLLRALTELGCDEAELRRRVPLPRGSRFTRLDYARLDELMEAGLELTGDPLLGLRLCGATVPESGGSLGLLLLASPDLRGAMRRVMRRSISMAMAGSKWQCCQVTVSALVSSGWNAVAPA